MADIFEVERLELQTLKLARAGALDQALRLISEFLDRNQDDEFRSHVLGHRADLLHMAGRFDEAREVLLAAHELAQENNYHRYSLELALELDARRRNDRAAQIEWSDRALATAAADPTTSGHVAALSLLGLVGEGKISDVQRKNCVLVLSNAAQILGAESVEFSGDLVAAFVRIRELFSQHQRFGPTPSEGPSKSGD